jgi:hypothetical protein
LVVYTAQQKRPHNNISKHHITSKVQNKQKKEEKNPQEKQTKAKLSTYNVFGHIKQLFKRERSQPDASHEQKGCESYDKEVLCAQQIFQQAAHTGHAIQWDLA